MLSLDSRTVPLPTEKIGKTYAPTVYAVGREKVREYAESVGETNPLHFDIEVARLKPEFDRRGVKVIGLSVDAADRHAEWARDIAETQGHALNFPLIADHDRKVAGLYGMIHPNASDTATVRSVFVIDPAGKLRLSLTYPASTGRNFEELLRVIDSLQLTDRHKVATPVNWRQGDDVIIVPSVSDEEAKALFPDGWSAPRPYLRTVKQPA